MVLTLGWQPLRDARAAVHTSHAWTLHVHVAAHFFSFPCLARGVTIRGDGRGAISASQRRRAEMEEDATASVSSSKPRKPRGPNKKLKLMKFVVHEKGKPSQTDYHLGADDQRAAGSSTSAANAPQPKANRASSTKSPAQLNTRAANDAATKQLKAASPLDTYMTQLLTARPGTSAPLRVRVR